MLESGVQLAVIEKVAEIKIMYNNLYSYIL
jgi:hypothetical protein